METLKENQDTSPKETDILDARLQRRAFLQYAGAGAAVMALVAAGCKKDRQVTIGTDVALDFNKETDVLNYAYALEQLEAAFYIKVASSLPSSFTEAQKNYFRDVQYHEIAHREFFKRALGAAAIGNLEVDFSSINFSDGAAVLNVAKTFEDLGVAAYNAAGPKLKTPAFLLAAGKIVSVEARHAAWVRDQISNGSFADLTSLSGLGADNGKGLDAALTADKVLAAASKYIKTKITVSNFTI